MSGKWIPCLACILPRGYPKVHTGIGPRCPKIRKPVAGVSVGVDRKTE